MHNIKIPHEYEGAFGVRLDGIACFKNMKSLVEPFVNNQREILIPLVRSSQCSSGTGMIWWHNSDPCQSIVDIVSGYEPDIQRTEAEKEKRVLKEKSQRRGAFQISIFALIGIRTFPIVSGISPPCC